MATRLCDLPTRRMTDRECAGLLTGVLGVLHSKAEAEVVRRALRWCWENEAEIFRNLARIGNDVDGGVGRLAASPGGRPKETLDSGPSAG